MQVILDSSFVRPGSAPIHGAGRNESSGTGLDCPSIEVSMNLALKNIKCIFTTEQPRAIKLIT